MWSTSDLLTYKSYASYFNKTNQEVILFELSYFFNIISFRNELSLEIHVLLLDYTFNEFNVSKNKPIFVN